MITLPTEIQIQSAQLPKSYENAKTALAECSRLDECQAGADKAAALASYAKQAEDDTLYAYARRIQSRAVNRSGELLKQIEAARGGDRRSDQWEGDRPLVTRTQAAAEAGMSEHQRKTALRVASIPGDEFEALVESDDPPSVTELARLGTQSKPRPEFNHATTAIGTLREFAEFCRKHDPIEVASGVYPHEAPRCADDVAEVDAWLDRFIVNLRSEANE